MNNVTFIRQELPTNKPSFSPLVAIEETSRHSSKVILPHMTFLPSQDLAPVVMFCFASLASYSPVIPSKLHSDILLCLLPSNKQPPKIPPLVIHLLCLYSQARFTRVICTHCLFLAFFYPHQSIKTVLTKVIVTFMLLNPKDTSQSHHI